MKQENPQSLATISEFDRWLFNSRPGDRFTYHTGDLSRDRWLVNPYMIGNFVLGGVGREPTHTNAKHALRAHEDGLVYLLQIKLDNGIYDYVAQRRPNRRIP